MIGDTKIKGFKTFSVLNEFASVSVLRSVEACSRFLILNRNGYLRSNIHTQTCLNMEHLQQKRPSTTVTTMAISRLYAAEGSGSWQHIILLLGLLAYLWNVINIHVCHRKPQRALFKHFFEYSFMLPPKERMSALLCFFSFAEGSACEFFLLLFIHINPESQYATNSLILISYLKGEEVQK